MKQNKKYLAIVPIIAIIISLLYIPVYADIDSSGVAPIVTQSSTLDQYLHILSYPYAGMQTYLGTVSGDSFAFHVGSSMYVVRTPGTVVNFIYNGGLSWNPNDNFGSYDSTYDLYYSSWSNLSGTWYVPSYNSVAEGLSDIKAYVVNNGGNGSSSSYDLDYSLPPGNVAFVELTSNSSDLILTTDMPTLSNLFGSAWSNVSQMYGYSNSLPSSGSSFNTTGLSTIDWSKAAPFNVVGQSKNAAKILSVSNSSTFLVIYNPLYFYVRDGGNGAESSFLDNGYIRIRLNDVSNVKVFSLTSSAQIGPNASTEDAISSTVTSSGVTQTIDPDTGLPIWTDSDGNTVEAPGIGNGNIASSGSTTFSILQQIADTISNFFQGSVGAISNLIDNGSSFMSKLGTLYSWLPAPVYAVLTSALILVITIGVIKVFL